MELTVEIHISDLWENLFLLSLKCSIQSCKNLFKWKIVMVFCNSDFLCWENFYDRVV